MPLTGAGQRDQGLPPSGAGECCRSLRVFSLVAVTLIILGCASEEARKARPEHGPQGTIAFIVQVEASEPGVKIEANGDYLGAAPTTVKIFGDKDGTFHNFGNPNYTIKAIPARPGQRVQTKVFGTGGWFAREDRIPTRIYFEMQWEPVAAMTGSESDRRSSRLMPAEPVGPRSSGTGFFVSEDGYLVTNDHVVENGSRFLIVLGGEQFNAQLVRKDKSADLALLKVNTKTSGLPLAEAGDARVGQQIYSLAFPLTQIMGEEPKFTTGTINALKGSQDDSSQFQFSAQVTFGNSGGPLVNERGNVVGVVVATLHLGQNVNYAIKSSRLRIFIEDEPGMLLKEQKHGHRMASEEVFTYLRPATVRVLVY